MKMLNVRTTTIEINILVDAFLLNLIHSSEVSGFFLFSHKPEQCETMEKQGTFVIIDFNGFVSFAFALGRAPSFIMMTCQTDRSEWRC